MSEQLSQRRNPFSIVFRELLLEATRTRVEMGTRKKILGVRFFPANRDTPPALGTDVSSKPIERAAGRRGYNAAEVRRPSS
jgi:hypothetical protein